jgi:membrane-associated phospholipid phosphatase
MKRFFNLRFFLFIFLYSSSAGLNAFEYSLNDFKQEIMSPIDVKPANNIFLYGSLLTVSLKIFGEKDIIDPFQEAISNKNQLGEWNDPVEIMGRWVPNLAYSGGMLIKYYFSPDNKALEQSFAMMKATLYSGALTTVLKHTVRQRRPGGGQKTSFPSGHTTTAFAFAAVVGTFHEWYYAVPAYTIATAVAFQRLTNNNHYLHDVLAGATIGIAYGVGVATVVKKKDSFLENVTILPISSDGMMVGYSYSF